MDLANAEVGQLLIPVTDLERAIEFYRFTLGIPFLFTAPPQMSFFQCGSVRLLVGVPEAGSPFEHGSAVYFKVPDIQAAYAELVDRGVEFKAEPQIVHRTLETDLWLAEFNDPDGNVLMLMSETKAA